MRPTALLRPLSRFAAGGRTAASILTLALVFAFPGAGGAESASFKLDVHSKDGDDVHLSIGTGFLSAMVRTFAPMALDCDTSADPKVRRLFRELERAGEPSRGTLRDDGDLLEARREGGTLEMTVTDGDDGDVARISMPWAVARCVLGGEKVSRKELEQAFEGGEFEIHVEDGEEEAKIEIN